VEIVHRTSYKLAGQTSGERLVLEHRESRERRLKDYSNLLERYHEGSTDRADAMSQHW
jgi:hypothetical protein